MSLEQYLAVIEGNLLVHNSPIIIFKLLIFIIVKKRTLVF
jgi:hypothetical protein